MSRTFKVTLHLVLLLLRIGIMLVLYEIPLYDPANPAKFYIRVSLLMSTHTAFTYLLYFFVVPDLLERKRLLQKLLVFLTGVAVYWTILTVIWNLYTFEGFFNLEKHMGGIIGSVLAGFFFSLALRSFEYWFESEQRKQALQKEVKETELLFLQSQVSPHFLFNTLNNIYGLSLKGSASTVAAIAQLREMMEYFSRFEKEGTNSLQEEIRLLKSYINLNELRFEAEVIFDINIPEYPNERPVVPMVLLPFVENAFKHGETGKSGTIFLSLFAADGSLRFKVRNQVGKNKRKDSVGGIGINNVKRRLELLYPSNYQLLCEEKNGVYSVDLIIP